jgi:hypothetical protein
MCLVKGTSTELLSTTHNAFTWQITRTAATKVDDKEYLIAKEFKRVTLRDGSRKDWE